MKNYDRNNESTYLMYVDANSLYGYAMEIETKINTSSVKRSSEDEIGTIFSKNYVYDVF